MGTAWDSLASAKVEVLRLASKIDGVKGCYNGSKTDQRATVIRDEAMDVRERDRDKAKITHNRLEESEVRRDRLMDNLQGLLKVKDNFDHMIEDFGVGEERV